MEDLNLSGFSKELKGERVTLKSLHEKDYSEKYFQWLQDKRVNRFLETRHTRWDKKAILKFIKDQRNSADSILFGMFLEDRKSHIGNIKLGPINAFHKYADISYFLGELREQGKGYMSEALKLIIQFSREVGLKHLLAGVYSTNELGIKVLERNNFILCGNIKNKLLDNYLGERADHLIYSYQIG